MKKKILIDASVVTGLVDGWSVYVLNLLKHLPESSFAEFEYSLLLNPEVERPELRALLDARPFAIEVARITQVGPRRDWDMYRYLAKRRNAFDLIHITSNSYPFALSGGVCTFHDMTFKRFFDDPYGIPGAGRLAAAYLEANVRHCLRRADRIISVSRSTMNDVQHFFGATPEQMAKFRVIHEGWEHLEAFKDALSEPFPHVSGGYLFFLGSHRVHKNLKRLLEAFELALPSIPADKTLIISGTSGSLSGPMRNLLERINSGARRVEFTGYLSNADVSRYYRHADAFIFPSLAEGFGIPALESFLYETPLLCSDTTSLPEVAGEAALYFNPQDTRAIADAIVRFYREPELGPRLAALGRERLAHFSWRRAAAETVEMYRDVLAEANQGLGQAFASNSP